VSPYFILHHCERNARKNIKILACYNLRRTSARGKKLQQWLAQWKYGETS